MSDALIVAIIGQTVTLAIVFIQQWFSNRNLKLQLKNENKKQYYMEKRQAYKMLIDELNVDFIDRLFLGETVDLNFFYKEVYLYASREIFILFGKFSDSFENFKKAILDKDDEKSKTYAREMSEWASKIMERAKKEFEDM